MTPETIPDSGALLACKITVPHHVVYRSFPSETVVLNLETGRYHGLNATAGAMLAALERGNSVEEAAAAVAAEYQQSCAIVEQDMCALCALLLQRGLVELDADSSA
jgi:hypothetical protein